MRDTNAEITIDDGSLRVRFHRLIQLVGYGAADARLVSCQMR
jgi:hypothetical protein